MKGRLVRRFGSWNAQKNKLWNWTRLQSKRESSNRWRSTFWVSPVDPRYRTIESESSWGEEPLGKSIWLCTKNSKVWWPSRASASKSWMMKN